MYVLAVDDLEMTEYPDWTLYEINDDSLDVSEFVASGLGFATDLDYGDYFKTYDVDIVVSSDELDKDVWEDAEDSLDFNVAIPDLLDYLGYDVDQVYYASDLADVYD